MDKQRSTKHYTKTKKNELYLMWKSCWTLGYVNTNTCSINRTWNLYQKHGSQDESNIVLRGNRRKHVIWQCVQHELHQDNFKNMGELRCSRRVNSSCSTCGTRRVTLVTNMVTSHEWEKYRIVITTNETYQWSFVTLILLSG